jgi:hypothetical protein
MGNRTYTFSDFKTLFNSTSIADSNLTVLYNLDGVNWSLKHKVMSNSSIALHLRKLGNIAFRIRSADIGFSWGFETFTLGDVIAKKEILGLNIVVQNMDHNRLLESCAPDTYLPLANASGAPYSWKLVAVFSDSVVLNESLTSIWEKGIADLALAKIPKDLNLDWITGWCSGAHVQATVTCGEKVLKNFPPITLVSAQGVWFYPTSKNCSVLLAFAGKEKVCNASILELGKCKPEIYPVEVSVIGTSSYEPVEVTVDGVLLDLQHPKVCLWAGAHTLEVSYNLGGKWVTLMKRDFVLNAPLTFLIRLNLSRIEIFMHGCAEPPRVLVNGIRLNVEKRGEAYMSEPIPAIDTNVTLKICNVTLTLTMKVVNTTLTIELPTTTYLEFEHPSTFPLLILLALAIAQIAFVAYAWIMIRRL